MSRSQRPRGRLTAFFSFVSSKPWKLPRTLFFFNGHDCTFKGTGEWAGDELRFPNFEGSSEG